jgi:hypothetical protein
MLIARWHLVCCKQRILAYYKYDTTLDVEVSPWEIWLSHSAWLQTMLRSEM